MNNNNSEAALSGTYMTQGYFTAHTEWKLRLHTKRLRGAKVYSSRAGKKLLKLLREGFRRCVEKDADKTWSSDQLFKQLRRCSQHNVDGNVSYELPCVTTPHSCWSSLSSSSSSLDVVRQLCPGTPVSCNRDAEPTVPGFISMH